MVRAHHVSLRWLILIPSFLLFLSPSLTVAGVGLRWLDLHPHPCKPSQIGASCPPGPSSSPSYCFSTVLSALALAVSRASSVDAPLQKLQARPQIICSPYNLAVHFGMAKKTARTSQEEIRRKHRRRCIDTWVSVTLIDAAVAELTLDASNYDPANPSATTSCFRSLYSHLRPRAAAGVPLLDVLFSIVLSM
ncbi:hypothetical protein DFH09DRAFT_1375897 [Mycena vulgaris]|nr:hypothetical protein DFH09DRAFT_1375897 [Mycena vulgaris]